MKMNQDHPMDDPRLTAYALNELEGADRDAVEELLKNDPAARQTVEEIRATADMLHTEFAREAGPALDETRRRAIQDSVQDNNPTQGRSRRPPILWKLAVAACLCLLMGAAVFTALKGGHKEFGSEKAAPGARDVARLKAGTNIRNLRAGKMVQLDAPSPANGPSGEVTPSASAPRGRIYSNGKDGDIRARRENVFDRVAEKKSGHAVAALRAYSLSVKGKHPAPAPGFLPSFSKNNKSELLDIDANVEREGDRKRPPTGGWDNSIHNTEAYDRIVENPFTRVTQDALSTFSIDVDTASYSNARRFLNQKQLPPRGAVRIEEFVNYFTYNYADPIDEHPFSAHVEVAGCPWNPAHRLVRVGLKGREVPLSERPASNLVFLLDVSGSMQPANKLPLVRRSMKMLLEQLSGRDRVAIAVYAGASGLVLPSTPCNETGAIHHAIDNLNAGGSTNGGAGIKLAYDVAVKNFIKGGVNRVILCTDGDFNVGVTNNSELVRLVEAKAKTGVFLSVLGFGMGNYKDARLEKLADKGNGNYAYIDTQREAKKVLVDQMAGTLIAIAKDVKIQIEFNPRQVEAFRLLGYENRILAHQDFRDDTKDAGEIGSGHTVTALYEIIPAGQRVEAPGVKAMKYQARNVLKPAAASNEVLTLWLRYKKPEGKVGLEMEVPVTDHGLTYTQASRDFKFAASVAAFAMILRDSKYKGIATCAQVLELAEEGKGQDTNGHRAEFLELVQKAKGLKR